MTPTPNIHIRHVARAHQALRRVGASSLGPHEFLDEVSKIVQLVVPDIAPFWSTIDPLSMLPTGALKTDKPADLVHAIWRNELVDDDVNAVADLQRRATPVATLSELHPAALAKSPRMQLIYRPAGIGDELRVLLRADGLVWGKGSLYRAHDDAPFTLEERAFVGSIVPLITAGLRRRLARRPVEAGDLIVPGVVTFDQGDHLISGTKEANRLMGLIPGESATTLRTVVVQARMQEEASIRVRLADGRWLLVQAARMHRAGEAAPEVAVTLMPAPRSIMLPVVLALYPLSARERQVAELLQGGLRTEEIAARLHISPHTLRDHIKSVFHKLQVNRRAELIALVGQYVAPDGDAGGE